MKFYKSLLFLLTINLFCAISIWAVFGLRFLIPAFVFLLALNPFLIFFNHFYFAKQAFSFFTPDDPYRLNQTFEDLKKIYKIKNVQLVKTKNQTGYSVFYFTKGNKYFIAFSEGFLESFSKKDIKVLLSYVFQMIQTGDVFFLSLLSGFLFLIEKIIYSLNYPFSLLTKKAPKKENLILIAFFRAFSLITRKIYKKLDKVFSFQETEKGQRAFSFQKKEKEQLALLLWKMHCLAKVCPEKTPPFLAPLFLINPLTDSGWDCYISLHPLIRDRLQSLGVNYPP